MLKFKILFSIYFKIYHCWNLFIQFKIKKISWCKPTQAHCKRSLLLFFWLNTLTCNYWFLRVHFLLLKLLHLNKLLFQVNKTGFFCLFRSGFHLNVWKSESWSWNWLRISQILQFVVIEESDKTILWFLFKFFGCLLNKSFNFDLKFVWLHPQYFLNRSIFNSWNLSVVISFPEFYCCDCKK